MRQNVAERNVPDATKCRRKKRPQCDMTKERSRLNV